MTVFQKYSYIVLLLLLETGRYKINCMRHDIICQTCGFLKKVHMLFHNVLIRSFPGRAVKLCGEEHEPCGAASLQKSGASETLTRLPSKVCV